ncbi:hypothetical protein EJ02DRAFT_458223 [Clathrospora elynae]|uniref:ThrRS/AlaRS common domain-containing protein n=1 Tax=Clathrospora elynae TaxID=706981 RepID=A0A6A5SDF2_9PLEO|nr:hypothetical protein EJ02DRAFT_458223 [Clathrospora elynae]
MGAFAAPTSAIVGALKCQKDSYCSNTYPQTLATETAQLSGKSKTKESTDPTKRLADGDSTPSKTYLIKLADSVLFSEGGGQHTDHGSITTMNNESNDSIPITNIRRHKPRRPWSTVADSLRCIYFSPVPISLGMPVHQIVDFTRRWDLMQQHTGQHLLSAIMDGMDLPTIGWKQCNEKIRDGIPITVETPEGRGSNSLPENYDREKGVVRFIKIENMDNNACFGMHLKQSSHIELILMQHMQSIRGTSCRLFFTASDRAISMVTKYINGLRFIGVSLSSSSATADVAAGVQRLGDQVSEARKKKKKTLAEIAKFEGEHIKSYLEGHQTAFLQRTTDGLDFIKLVVFEIKDTVKEYGVVVLCSGEVKTPRLIVLFGNPGLVEGMATKVKDVVSTAKWQKGEIEALKAAAEAK